MIGFELCTVLTIDVENRWNTIKDGFCKATKAILKYKGRNKKEWMKEQRLELNYSIQYLKRSG